MRVNEHLANPLRSKLAAEEHKLIACVHCGLCLEACPTYVITGDENDGPRGRIYLMRAVAEGRLPNDASSFHSHIDRCLGCRACEQACPAGVEYGQLLEAGRAEIFTTKNSFTNRLLRLVLRRVWLHPARLRFAFAASRLLRDTGLATFLRKTRIPLLISPRFEFALALLESSRSSLSNGKAVFLRSKSGQPALLFSGCVGEGLFARINQATERVLSVNGWQTTRPENQVCCGALHAHAGDLEGARLLARRNVAAFGEGDEPIVTNAGGCGAMLKSYGELLSDDELLRVSAAVFSARVKDVSQVLDNPHAVPDQTKQTVTYDASCHLLYGQKAGDSSRRMLESLSQLDFVTLRGSERCCGAAGIYNLLEPKLSHEVLTEKLNAIEESGAKVLATGNAGCQMQIGAGAMLQGRKLRVCHPVELLDESYRQAGLYDKTD